MMNEFEKAMWDMKWCYRLVVHIIKNTPGGISVDMADLGGKAILDRKVTVTTIGDKVVFRTKPIN